MKPVCSSRLSSANTSPILMGVLNVTPDSFSDGGKFTSVDAALHWAEKMANAGADIIDVGGESTRPGADEVSAQEEMDRVLPVLEAIRERIPVFLSIDTRKFEVAEQAVRAGARIVNDITAGSDVRLATLVRDQDLIVILMHMQGTPKDMQNSPWYRDGVVTEVKKFLEARVRNFLEVGVNRSKIWVDPGIGFGKTPSDNLDLLRHLSQFKPREGRLVIGTSRKSFLSKLLGGADIPVEERLSGTIASNLWAWAQGASVFRVHDVLEMSRVFKTWESIRYGSF